VRFALVFLLVLVLDQLSKFWVTAHFHLHESVPVLPGFFSLTYLTNTGAAFGLLAGRPALWRQVFFIGVGLAALVAIALLHRRLAARNRYYAISLAMIAGGAVGNLLDRIRLGAVIDFLDFYLGRHHWPAFNLADSAITLGVGLFFLLNLRDGNGSDPPVHRQDERL